MGIENLKGIQKNYSVNISDMKEFVNSLSQDYKITLKEISDFGEEKASVSPVWIDGLVEGKRRWDFSKETYTFRDNNSNEKKGSFEYRDSSESYWYYGHALNDQGY